MIADTATAIPAKPQPQPPAPLHPARPSSLPSIDEGEDEPPEPRPPPDGPRRRGAPSGSAPGRPRFSLKSISSERSAESADGRGAGGITSEDLLANMMQHHRDRDPYRYYAVLESLGQGSIGSVEKVVRKHQHQHRGHGLHSPRLVEAPPETPAPRSFFLGGIFNDCCVARALQDHYGDDHHDNSDNADGHGHGNGSDNLLHRRQQSLLATFFGGLCSRLTNSTALRHRHDNVFQPSPTNINTNSDDSRRSAVSENSAFSAPDFDRPSRLGSDSGKLDRILDADFDFDRGGRANSVRSDGSAPRRGPRHALRRYALKSIRLDRTERARGRTAAVSAADEAELRNEIAVLRSLDHPRVVHVVETYEYRRSIYLVIDLCEGGDLYVMDPYREGEARAIAKQLLQAVGYIHRRGVVHRDLKYENVMFVDRADRSRMSIKIIDFGLSMKYGGSKKSMTDFVGTIYTMAPEVIRGNYTYKCDLWSLGVMTYMLLSSQIPFVGRDMADIAKEIMRGRYSFSGRKWNKISMEGRDFINSLLVRDASKRPNADQALKHPWINQAVSPSKRQVHRRHSSDCIGSSFGTTKMAPSISLDYQICQSIERFASYSWLHRLALMVLGYRYTGKETALLREVFSSFDYKNDGTIQVDELRQAFALHDKYSNEEIDEIFSAVDMNGAGLISWTEFLAATIEAIGTVGEEEFAECFHRLDCDNSGYISTGDLREILGDLPDDVFDRIIDESDLTRDQKIWRHEFMALLDEGLAEHTQNDSRKPLHFVFKRSNSADDLNFLSKMNIDFSSHHSSILTEEIRHESLFEKEKAKSVRKMSKFS